MKRFLVTYLAPASVIDDWKKTDPEKRKAGEEKMQNDWKKWMSNHHDIFVDKGAGVGKTRRVTANGSAAGRNDIMLYAIVQAETHEAASKNVRGSSASGNSELFHRDHGDSSSSRNEMVAALFKRARHPRAP